MNSQPEMRLLVITAIAASLNLGAASALNTASQSGAGTHAIISLIPVAICMFIGLSSPKVAAQKCAQVVLIISITLCLFAIMSPRGTTAGSGAASAMFALINLFALWIGSLVAISIRFFKA